MIDILSCPHCGKPPEVKYRRNNWIFICDEHGHIAMGDTYAQAAIFWNRYIQFVKGVNPCSSN